MRESRQYGSVRGALRNGRPYREHRTRTLEPLHLALPPSRRLMRILGPIVLPSPTLMQVLKAELASRSAI